MQLLLERLYQGFRLALRAAVMGALLLTAFRLAFLFRHTGPQTHLAARDLGRALLMGARFDLKVGTVMALPLVVLGALRQARRVRWAAAAWTGFSVFWLTIAAMVNDGYFAFYHTPIDSIVFGLFEDDTAAVFRSLWEDRPSWWGLSRRSCWRRRAPGSCSARRGALRDPACARRCWRPRRSCCSSPSAAAWAAFRSTRRTSRSRRSPCSTRRFRTAHRAGRRHGGADERGGNRRRPARGAPDGRLR